MAVCPHLRGALQAGLLAAAVFLPLESLARAQAVPWLTDRNAARQQAQKQGKLLLVVHLSSDFTANPLASRELELYQRTALADSRVASLLKQRFVLLVAGVGEATTLRLPRSDKSAAQEAAVAYVCLPDERVLHFVPGFPQVGELLKELAWAEQCYAALAKHPAAKQPLAARLEHLAMLLDEDQTIFRQRFASRWNITQLAASGETTVDLPAAVAAARNALEAILSKRLGPQWKGEERAGGLAALLAHVGVSADLAHMILGEFPLTALSDLAPPAYAATCGRRYFSVPARRAELSQWWSQAARAGQPTLLVVVYDDYFTAASRILSGNPFDGHEYRWPPESTLALPHLSRFATQVVTLDELSLLLADARLGEVRYVRERPLRFLLHDSRGFRVAELAGSEATLGRLAEVMKEH